MFRAIWLLAIVLVTARGVHAQDSGASASPGASKDSSFMNKASRAIMAAFDSPLHPVLKGVAPGGGIGAGIEYDFLSGRQWQASTKAVMTARRYWVAELDTTYHARRARVDAYARMRDMTQVNFFGAGSDSDLHNRTSFRLRDPVVGALASVHPFPWFAIGGRVEQLWPQVDRGQSVRFPSIEHRFVEREAPGLTAQPRFGRYQAFVDIDSPPAVGESLHQGGRYRIAYGVFDDQQFDRFTFRRLDLEAQHQLALFGAHRRLTLHGWVSAAYTDGANDVPFFLQHTLGGAGIVASVNEQLIGSDGAVRTLRAFERFRFRDRNLLVLQAEYRLPVWGPLDATVFMDAGKVTSRRAELNLSDLKRSYGFSLNVMRGPGTLARLEVGLGGGEGTQVFFSIGKTLTQ